MKSLSSDPPSTVKISVHGMIVPFDRLLPNHYIIMIMEFRTYTPRCQSFSWSPRNEWVLRPPFSPACPGTIPPSPLQIPLRWRQHLRPGGTAPQSAQPPQRHRRRILFGFRSLEIGRASRRETLEI